VLDQPSISLANHCSLRVGQHVDTATLWLTGEFDLACEGRFREAVRGTLDAPVGTLVFDLRGLEFIDSTGLGLLVQIDAAARSGEIEFVVLCRDGQVRRVLRESGLDGLLPVVDPSGAMPASESPV
jgi:anti-anti-sigma factor